jgi:hypothetical protein
VIDRLAIKRALRPGPLMDKAAAPIADAGEMRAAGIAGLVAGLACFVAGGVVGTLLMNLYVHVFARRGHTTSVPRFVFAILYGLAVYGLAVFMQGTVRILESSTRTFRSPRKGMASIAMLLLLALEGTAALLATFLLIHYADLAQFVFTG